MVERVQCCVCSAVYVCCVCSADSLSLLHTHTHSHTHTPLSLELPLEAASWWIEFLPDTPDEGTLIGCSEVLPQFLEVLTGCLEVFYCPLFSV